MTNSNDTIGNRTRDLPARSTVPQPTVSPHAPFSGKDVTVVVAYEKVYNKLKFFVTEIICHFYTTSECIFVQPIHPLHIPPLSLGLRQ
jgi:hypothetical protein